MFPRYKESIKICAQTPWSLTPQMEDAILVENGNVSVLHSKSSFHEVTRMAATIKDIASKTGLGLATISRYLNGGNVKEHNRLAIEDAIAELNFTVNEFARSLKTSKSKTIGVIIPELTNVFVASIITVMEDILRKCGYGVIVCDCRTNLELEREAVRFLVNKTVDGIINMPVGQSGDHLLPALERMLPVILLDRLIPDLSQDVDSVVVDNVQASYDAVNYLINQGHYHIGIIAGPRNIFTSKQRLAGYRQALKSHGLPFDSKLVRCSEYSMQAGYQSATGLIKEQKEMTAIFATNYEMTLGALMALNEQGVKIPSDISLIGFDNLELSRVVKPKLTIVTQPIEEIGRRAADLMLTRLKEIHTTEIMPPQIITLPTSIIMGESVKDQHLINSRA